MKVDSSLCLSSVQVSSSTPVATKPETEVAEDEDEPIAKLHLSGYFPSLEDRLPSTLMALIYLRGFYNHHFLLYNSKFSKKDLLQKWS